MQIAIPLFNGVTPLDVAGPYDVLARVPGASVVLVGAEKALYRDEYSSFAVEATATFDEITKPDVVVVPGGPPEAVGPACQGPIPAWLRAVHPSTRWTTSVCTGALLLGAAGLLVGREATTHWAGVGVLRQMGATPVAERIVTHPDERLMLAAGVSSGIDMALALVAKLVDDERAQCVQLALEYDPAPPFDAGSPAKAPKAVYEKMCVELKAQL
ncbi:hypothetical protein PPSIR1_29890 [Plesiocystis pacifica SIR-1]|uniref:DJ-1/PfpI domain-containing protein n=1 Tax=Plesiocystis pacifica SIR-1 TaxID=391625 RepID=A6FYV7_9BACT|nr:DJ-1/PfpI family protein [Plesiocystis pacifica]EDM81112.1 hypothetical protein PPSIR1_29890 [Plesiocystis pacifica SIR-1]